jgi:hypothetical protein
MTKRVTVEQIMEWNPRECYTESRILRLIACMCAERALERERARGREPHPDSWRAIEIARKFVDGDATDDELRDAHIVAVDAANVDR